MKRDLGNAIRAELAAELLKFFTEKGEDIDDSLDHDVFGDDIDDDDGFDDDEG